MLLLLVLLLIRLPARCNSCCGTGVNHAEFDQVTIEAAHYSWLGRRSWQPLLTDISLQLAPGEIVALVGER